MIRAANHSSYPRIGDFTLDERLEQAHQARARGEAGAADVARVADEMGGIVVAEQSRAFINVVTDGMVRWPGPLSHLTDHLEGLTHGERRPWLGTRLIDRRPVVTGPVRAGAPFLRAEYEVAMEVAQTPVKMSLPGPVSFGRLCQDRHYGDLDLLVDDLAEALAAEVRELAAAGASWFQLDEPLLCRHAGDLERVVRAAGRVFEAAPDGAVTVLSTYFGDLTALGRRVAQLPGTHLGLDMVSGDGNLDLLSRLPGERGVVLGLFDARTTRIEDAADVAARLEPHREQLVRRDVIVGPQAGLGLLPRDEAFDKLLQARYLVEQLEREWDWSG